ncbi:hypothetical protein VYU27_009181 [Nannochloropsis oceanica]
MKSISRHAVSDNYDAGGHSSSSTSGQDQLKAHGHHITLDYTSFFVDARDGAALTMSLIRAAVKEAGVREVHSHMEVLGEDGLSPPGFTGICLIDESHVSAHCYSERGWLALDVFTCGKTDPAVIAGNLHKRLTAAVPGLRMIRGMNLDRFLHVDMDMEGEGGGRREEGEGGPLVLDRWMAVEDETSYYNNADKHRWGRQGGEAGGGRFAEEGREEGEEEQKDGRMTREKKEEKEGIDR